MRIQRFSLLLIAAFAASKYSVTEGLLVPCFDHKTCIEVGSSVKFNCTVEDLDGYGGTVWSGHSSIFNCPSNNSASHDKIFLPHRPQQTTGSCGSSTASSMPLNVTHFVSTLTIQNVTLSMDGGKVHCSFYHEDDLVDEPTNLTVEGQSVSIHVMQGNAY